MAEYYAVLSRAVSGLESNSPDARRAVYDKARNALIGQLKAIDPPLPTAEISRQRLELEEAIRRVEREAGPAGGTPLRMPAKRTAPAPSGPDTATRPASPDVFRRAVQEAESAPEPPRATRAVARAEEWSTDKPERPERAPPPKPVPQYLPSQGYVEESPRSDEPRLAPDYEYEWSPKDPPAAGYRPPSTALEPYVDGRERQAKGRTERRDGGGGGGGRERTDRPDLGRPRRDDSDMMAEHAARPSRLPTILLLILIVAMLGGLGALGWSQRAILADLLGSFDHGSAPAPVASAPEPAPAPLDTSGKDTDSLLGSGDQSPTAPRVITPQDNSALPAPATPALQGDTQQAGAQPGGGDADSLVAQHATLYEAPLDAAAANGVVAINAAVTWAFQQGTEGPEIVANLDVPERNMKVKMTIRRNNDQSLPASHVVELVLNVPNNFPGKAIRDVPRIVFKPSEDAKGQPLIGASAKVADGFFWIALSGEPQDSAANLALLRDRGWIDLPILYETGQRAIITFEKGTPGERVFQKALTAWGG